jgi:hypothetical protein
MPLIAQVLFGPLNEERADDWAEVRSSQELPCVGRERHK